MSSKRLEDVLKISWRSFSRRLKDVLARRLEDVLKTSSKRLEDVLKTSWRRLEEVLKTSWRLLEDVLKTSWRRLEDVLKTYGQDEYIGLDQDVLKTSSEDVTQQTFFGLQHVLKTSWRHVLKMSSTRLQRNNFTSSKTSWRRMAKTNILVLTKTSSEDVRLRRTYSSWSRRLEDVFKTSSEGEDERRLQDAFIKTNVCRDRVLAIKSKHYKWNVLKLFTGAVVRRCSSK